MIQRGITMFIDRLNDGEKKILIDLLMHLVKVDNKFSKREASHLLSISKKYDLDMTFSQVDSIKELCLAIKCEASKVIILQELIWAAKIDRDYCDEEEVFVNEVKDIFEISSDMFQLITRWVDNGIRWQEDGLKLLST